MHSFHHSRGRILFEVLCALTVSASCVGAWIQTGASAFLPAAAAAALYALAHAFDLAKARPALAAPMPSVETPAGHLDEIPDDETMAPPPVEEAPSAEPVAAVELTEPAIAEKPKPRRAKAPRKAAKGSAKVVVTELKPVEVATTVPEPEMDSPDMDSPDMDSPDMDSSDMDSSDMDSAPVPIAPLFEPEPFVRQQRTVFGRKAG